MIDKLKPSKDFSRTIKKAGRIKCSKLNINNNYKTSNC